MVTNRQVRRLWKLMEEGKTLKAAAAKADMDEKTARKYVRLGRLPSEVAAEHRWRTREDPFAEVWEELEAKLWAEPGLEAKTLFDDLAERHPGRFAEGQLRTLQRRVKEWRALCGPPKEVFFAQEHRPGELSQSDFTHLSGLGVTIQGQPFPHLLYHFVLPYSNWETGTICFSESFESLSAGLQHALWELGGVPRAHRTDQMSMAVNKAGSAEEFTRRYTGLLAHYGMEGRKIQIGKANENGDVEQSHHRIKRAIEQKLMLRGSRDFERREAYEAFLKQVFKRRNSGREKRLAEERAVLRSLPPSRLEAMKKITARVGAGSTIYVQRNVYSVPSRLIGERVEVRVHAERIEVWYAQKLMETMPRLRGESRHRIDYRHVIDWLVRKPGAFEQYKWREDLFPTTKFRLAYEELKGRHAPAVASREYLCILELAARDSETTVEEALRALIDREERISFEAVERVARSLAPEARNVEVQVPAVNLTEYDALLERTEAVA
jgi:hypothetical protein